MPVMTARYWNDMADQMNDALSKSNRVPFRYLVSGELMTADYFEALAGTVAAVCRLAKGADGLGCKD